VRPILRGTFSRPLPPPATWYESGSISFLPRCEISAVAWEGVVEGIQACDAEFGEASTYFYDQCLRYDTGIVVDVGITAELELIQQDSWICSGHS
jgi:hypothetical protein